MGLLHWGATAGEIAGPMPGDDICGSARIVATRSIDIPAPPGSVFPWLVQMGFGRAGWYSYDVLDNLGRRSATRIHPEWQGLSAGDTVPGGPVGFRAEIVDAPVAFVMRLDANGRIGGRICFTLAYELRPTPTGTRLVTRARARVDTFGGRLVERLLLGPGDGVMVRRQLLGLRRRITRAGA